MAVAMLEGCSTICTRVVFAMMVRSSLRNVKKVEVGGGFDRSGEKTGVYGRTKECAALNETER